MARVLVAIGKGRETMKMTLFTNAHFMFPSKQSDFDSFFISIHHLSKRHKDMTVKGNTPASTLLSPKHEDLFFRGLLHRNDEALHKKPKRVR